MAKPKRNTTIDFMRGFGVLLIILVHITVYFRHDPLAAWLWEYSQVAVPIFVFCSAYIYFSRPDEPLSFHYFTKRLKRLILPYYYFLLALFAYTFVIKGETLSFSTIINKTFFFNTHSRDLDWLVVLFVYFMFLMPLIRFLSKKPFMFSIGFLLTLFSGVFLLFNHTSIPMRFVMWLPWASVLFISYLINRFEKTKWFLPGVALYFFVIFLLSRTALILMGSSLVLTENKYPPNIFYLSYGVFLMILIYKGYTLLNLGDSFIQKGFDFLSRYSYSIFFIHFLLLYVLLDFLPYKQISWLASFFIIFITTCCVQWSITIISSLYYKKSIHSVGS